MNFRHPKATFRHKLHPVYCNLVQIYSKNSPKEEIFSNSENLTLQKMYLFTNIIIKGLKVPLLLSSDKNPTGLFPRVTTQSNQTWWN